MTSEARIEANRRNALKSTGPTSEEGKARVSQNSMRHGLCSRDVLLAQEDAGEFAELLRQFAADLQPRDLLERMAVDRIAGEYWRLGRASRLERDWMEAALEDEQRLIDRLFKDEDPAAVPVLRMGDALKRDFSEGIFDRLRRYEGRLDRSMARQLAELARLRKRKAEELTPDTSAAVDGSGAPLAGGLPFGAVDAAGVLPPANSAESQGHAQASEQAQAEAQNLASHGSQTTRTVAPDVAAANQERLAGERIARDAQRKRQDKPATAADGRGQPAADRNTRRPEAADRTDRRAEQSQPDRPPQAEQRHIYTPEENAYLHQCFKNAVERARQRELAKAAGRPWQDDPSTHADVPSGAGILPASAAAVPAAESEESRARTGSRLAGGTPAPLAGGLPFGAVGAAEVLPPANSAESQGHGQASEQAQAEAQNPASHGSQTARTVAPDGLPFGPVGKAAKDHAARGRWREAHRERRRAGERAEQSQQAGATKPEPRAEQSQRPAPPRAEQSQSPPAGPSRKRRRDSLGLARYDAECQHLAARRRFLQRQGTP